MVNSLLRKKMRALITFEQSRMYYYFIRCLTGLGKVFMCIGGPCVISKLQTLARQLTPCHIVTDAERTFHYRAFRFVHIHSKSANRCMRWANLLDASHSWKANAMLQLQLPLYSFFRRLDASVSQPTKAVARMSKEGLS